MAQTMKALVKPYGQVGLELVRDAPIPAIGPQDVLIRVVAASICGSDVHIYDNNPLFRDNVADNQIIGHEFCGEVVEVSRDVTFDCPRAFAEYVAIPIAGGRRQRLMAMAVAKAFGARQISAVGTQSVFEELAYSYGSLELAETTPCPPHLAAGSCLGAASLPHLWGSWNTL